jgi:hypothetical protein
MTDSDRSRFDCCVPAPHRRLFQQHRRSRHRPDQSRSATVLCRGPVLTELGVGRGRPPCASPPNWGIGLATPGGDAARARKALNAATIAEMHRAFREGGRTAILKVMKNQPAAFLKLLILLVPREMEVTHSGTVKAMTDDQIEATIAAIQDMLAKREAGENAKVIEGVETVASPAPSLMAAADAAAGARKRKPREVPSPARM